MKASDFTECPVGYLDFELEIGPGSGREYPVAVVRSPAGEARETMLFPFDELTLENRLQALQIALLRSGGERRQILSPEEQAVQDFGRDLFDALFTGEVRSRYDVSQQEVAQQGKGIRLKLRIRPPELAALPWEFLYDPRQAEYVCLSRNTPVVRYLELPQAIQPLSVTPPLRILGMVASPHDLRPLDAKRERQRVEEAIKDLRAYGLVDLTWLEGQTWRDLQRAMRGGPWHVFHFIGHGGFDRHADEGLLALAEANGQTHRLLATQLGRLLADHRSLRLVLLNSCEGARGSERDIFSSTAAILVRRGIPAVLAMQYEITDRAAIEFACAFYEALADGLPVDAAMAEARKAVSLAVTNTVEWGTPVLYMRSPDGVLFSIQEAGGEDGAKAALTQVATQIAGLLSLLTDRHRLQLIAAFTILVSAVVGFIGLAQGNAGLATIVLLAIGIGGAWLGCVYLARKRTQPRRPGERATWRYPWALAGVVIIPLLAASGLGYYLHQQAQPPPKVTLLVALFDGPEPQKYRVTETVLARLYATLAGYDDMQVEALGRAITEAEGSAVARAEGEKRKAAIVIWGWYGVMAEAVPMSVHFEVLRPPEYLPEPRAKGQVQMMAVVDPENFTLQTNLSAAIACLSLFTAGMARYTAGDWDGAIALFSDALSRTTEQMPALDQSKAYFYRGLAYAAKGDYDHAITDYNQTIQLQPNDALAYNNRGVVYYYKGDLDGVIADFDQAIQLQPNLAEAYYNRSLAYKRKGEKEKAIADLEKFLELCKDPYWWQWAEEHLRRWGADSTHGLW